MSKEELIKQWTERAAIEDEISNVFHKHDQPDKAEMHLAVARTWRHAACELRDDLKS